MPSVQTSVQFSEAPKRRHSARVRPTRRRTERATPFGTIFPKQIGGSALRAKVERTEGRYGYRLARRLLWRRRAGEGTTALGDKIGIGLSIQPVVEALRTR